MKSNNRMRFYQRSEQPLKPHSAMRWSFDSATNEQPVRLADMPNPVGFPRITPDQVVEDILISTLRKLQKSGNAEISAAAERYLSNLR